MATEASTQVQSSELVGVPQSVNTVISMLDPDKTKFISMIGKQKIDETIHNWLEDVLRQPGANAAVEGARAVPTPRDQPEMLSNCTQIFQDTFSITGTSQAVRLYGRTSETNRQTVKAGLALKQDVEFAAVAGLQQQRKGTPSVAGLMGSVQTLIHPDHIQTLGSGDTGGTLTEDLLNSALQTLWEAGADTSVIMGPGPIASTIASYAHNGRTVQQAASATKLVAHVDIYEGPYGGPQTVVKNRVFQKDGVLIMDPDNFALATLRPWNRKQLAVVGDSQEFQILSEHTLTAENRKRAFMFLGVAN